MSLLLNDVYDFLTVHVGHTTGWLMYKSYLPDEQDQCVSIFETPGMPADTMEHDNERVGFQVRVRGQRLDYVVVRQKWQDIFNALQESYVLPTGYILMDAEQYGPLIFNDANGRVNMTMNFRVIRLRSLSGA